MTELRTYLDHYFQDLQQTNHYYCYVKDNKAKMQDVHQGQVKSDMQAKQLTQTLSGAWQKQKMATSSTLLWLYHNGKLSLSRYMQQELQPRTLAEFDHATTATSAFHCGRDIYYAWIGRQVSSS